MHLQPPYWDIILAVLGLFQSTLEDCLSDLAVTQMDLPSAAVPEPQPAVEHAAITTSTRWCVDFCVMLHLWSQRKIDQEGEPNWRGREGSSQESNEACAFVKKLVDHKLGHGWLRPHMGN